MKHKVNSLIAQARGGRVVRSSFFDRSDFDQKLLQEDISFCITGGFPDAQRVVLTLYPSHIPAVDTGVTVVRLTPLTNTGWNTQDLSVQLRLGLLAEQLGEIRQDKDSFLVAITSQALPALLALTELNGQPVKVQETIQASQATAKKREVVVPSMRVDVVGAKGFGVSRVYFQQGIDTGKVRLNGQVVRASTEIHEGDTLIAHQLGRIDFKRVLHETRRGNFKVELEVQRT